ncbi:zinc transporter 7-like [Amphiura filiformis]|uniref:zinc transporter 7-like n=1 Tax=Amphiura filiformis TaxID=82378 RepID=UPI003B2230A0
MLPLHNKDDVKGARLGIGAKLSGWWRAVFSDQTSRNLFMFLLLNLSFAFVELFYGVLTNSLGLISDSFHMFFDCTALLAGLAASVISKWRATQTFSYGYVRAEILAGFINGLFLLFIAFFIFSEAVERIVEPPEVRHERLFVVSVLGFAVNLVGIFAFQHGGHGHSHGGSSNGDAHGHGHSHGVSSIGHGHSHSHSSHGHGHSHGLGLEYKEEEEHHQHTPNASERQIMHGVFLHILADTLGSVGVIISAVLMHYFGWMIVDPICSMLIALLIMMSVLPLLRDSVSILMMRTPRELDDLLPGCFHRVTELDGVYSIHEPHFWTLCSDVFVGTVKVEVAPNADAKYIISQTHNIFTQAGVRQLFVQLDFATD